MPRHDRVLFCQSLDVQPQVRFAFPSIWPVTLQTMFGENWPYVLIESNVCGRRNRRQQEGEDNRQQTVLHKPIPSKVFTKSVLADSVSHVLCDLGISILLISVFSMRPKDFSTVSRENLQHNSSDNIGQTIMASGQHSFRDFA